MSDIQRKERDEQILIFVVSVRMWNGFCCVIVVVTLIVLQLAQIAIEKGRDRGKHEWKREKSYVNIVSTVGRN